MNGEVVACDSRAENVRRAFFDKGFLIPAVLPVLYILGRAPYNILAFIYAGWALFAVYNRFNEINRRYKVGLLLLYLAFFLAVPFSVNPERALRGWLTFVLSTQVFCFSLIVFQARDDALDRFMRLLAVSTLFAPLVLFVKAGLMAGEWGQLIAYKSWQETSIPFLSIFLLWLCLERFESVKRYIFCGLVLAVSLLYVLLSGGRSALLALLLSSTLFFFVGFRAKLGKWLAVALLVGVLFSCVAGTGLLNGGFSLSEVTTATSLDTVSSQRTRLWRQAFNHPPENIWTGVGIGNVRYYEDVVAVSEGKTVKHLHNFLLDIWYETGLLGLAASCVLMYFFFSPTQGLFSRFCQEDLRKVAAILSALAAIFIAGLFSIGYTSPHFKVFVFMLCAGLVSLQQKRSA